jgi:hypothetical protein
MGCGGRLPFTKQAVTPETMADSLSEGASSVAQQLAADIDHGS